MAENSKIEWTDHTFNPWIGCQKVSAGCDNCYAEAIMDHRYGRVKWGPHGERVRTSTSTWGQPIRWNKTAAKAGVRARVFCASLADWLDKKAPDDWRDDVAKVVEMALAHVVASKVEAAYRRGDMLDRRRPLMMAWERYLCQERAEVIDLAAIYNRR